MSSVQLNQPLPVYALSKGCVPQKLVYQTPNQLRHSCAKTQQRRLSVKMQAATTEADAGAKEAFKPSKPTLFDVPVSNNGARVRFIIYKKGLQDQIDIKKPADIGGLKSDEYLSFNPQGKMPLLVLPDGHAFPESLVIESYILDKYKSVGPSLIPDTPEKRALANLAVRLLDIYICSKQGCMYKAMDATVRAECIKGLSFQLDVLENTIAGPFVAGEEISYADGALMPTFVFLDFILPRYFGWKSIFTNRPKLQTWWNKVKEDPVAAKVIDEIINGGLTAWEANDRWETLGINAQVADKSFDWTIGN